MARLKVKQISDFTSAVADAISNATADETASINSLEVTEGAARASIDSIETVDSKQTADIATNAGGVSTNASAISDLETFEGNTNTALGVLDASVDSLEVVDAAAIASINSLEVVDSKQTADIATNAGGVSTNAGGVSTNASAISDLETFESNANTALGVLDASVDSIELVDSKQTVDIAANATAINNLGSGADASIDSIELVDSKQTVDIAGNASAIGTERGRIDSILSGSSVDLDQFVEIVNFVASHDTVNDNLLSNYITVANGSIDSLEVVDAAAIASINSIETVDSKQTADIATNAGGVSTNASAISDLETFEGNTNTALGVLDASVDSIELVDSKQTVDIATNAGGVSTNASAISDLETFESNANTALGVLDASVDSIELVDSKQTVDIAANASAISSNDSDISTLQGKVTALEGDSAYRKQYATVNSATQATIGAAVEFASDDDISVFVNGHGIGYYTAGTGGWSSTNGTAFTFTDIGYDLEDDDVVYVIAHA
jgi:hypothetical protein